MNVEKDIALERIVSAKGIELVAKGAKLVGRCPFGEHDGNTLTVDPKANTWTCFEGCGEGGVVAFVARSEGVSVTHALELWKGDFTPSTTVAKKSTRLIGASLLEPDEPDAVVLDRALAYYTRTLLDSAEALKFLHDRGIRDPDVIPHFKLGYCDRTLGYKIPKANRKAGAAIRAQLLRLGVLRESGHEHFRGSLVVPVFDEHGAIVNLYDHKLRDDLRAGTPEEVWLNESVEGVLNAAGLVEGGKVILAGSVLDTLAWWSHGHRNVTTTFGRSTIPTAVRSLLVAREIRSVAVALRRDDDGDKAFEAISTELRALGAEVVRVLFPSGSDAVAVAKGGGGSLDAAMKAANWVSAGTPVERPPAAPGTTTEPEPTSDTGEVVIALGDRRWRVRGLSDNTSHGSIRVNLLVSRGDTAAFHVDTIELYSARQRQGFLAAASSEVGVEERILKKDLGSVLLTLEKLVDERLRATLTPEKVAVAITEGDRDNALGFLRDPNILDRIVSDFDALGVVGEATNKLVAYLAAVSRKLPKPLAVVLQSSPAAGKSALLEAALKLVPTEDVLAFSAITGRSLFYLPADGLAHKVLAIAEEEGAGKASYALKLLHSEGSLSIASTAKDTKTGRLATHTYGVKGPVALLLTTTALDVDEELLSRCIVLAVDEGREHTGAIHKEQRRRLALPTADDTERVVKLHHDAQRLLRPCGW